MTEGSPLVNRSIELDELVEKWTLLDDEQVLVAGKRGATRLGFVLLLKFYLQHGRFPRGWGALPDDAVRFVAEQVKVPASELGLYEWVGRTNRYHQAQIREHLGFRECSVEDAEKLVAWLAAEVGEDERQRDRVREHLLARCRPADRATDTRQGRPDCPVGTPSGRDRNDVPYRCTSACHDNATAQVVGVRVRSRR